MKNCLLSSTLVLVTLLVGACAHPGTGTGAGMYRPDLNDDIVARVLPGQSAQEVTALLGLPYNRLRFDNLKSTASDYLYKDTWGYWVELSVMIGDDGRVMNKVSRRIDTRDLD